MDEVIRSNIFYKIYYADLTTVSVYSYEIKMETTAYYYASGCSYTFEYLDILIGEYSEDLASYIIEKGIILFSFIEYTEDEIRNIL